MTPDPVHAAIERGDAAARLLVAHRDALIHHLTALMRITGVEGLRACAAGAAETVIAAHARKLASPGAIEENWP